MSTKNSAASKPTTPTSFSKYSLGVPATNIITKPVGNNTSAEPRSGSFKIANAQQFWSGKPQSALPDDIKAHLVNVLGDLKNQNVGILKDYLDELETGRSTVIGAGAPHENDWQQLRGKVLNGGYVSGAASGGGAATSSGNRFTWQ